MKYLLPLWILINCRLIRGGLEWTVIGKVTDYGQNVTLFCHVSNCCPQDSGWDRYSPEQRTLFIDIKTGRRNKKYDGKVSRDGYTLIIQNLTKSDLNVSYSCVYGVTIGEPKFLLEENVFKKISSTQPHVPGSKIAAIIAGVLVLVAVSIFIYVWTRRKKKKRKSRGENKVSKEELNPFIPKLSAPVGPIEISNITENSVDIEWKSPEHNGGASIKDYSIEYSTDDAVTWTNAEHIDGTTHNFSLKGLQEDLSKTLAVVRKTDLPRCSEELFTKICKSRQVYHMTDRKKGKILCVSNSQWTTTDENTGSKSIDDFLTNKTYFEHKYRCSMGFDKTSILQLFKHMQYEYKYDVSSKDVSGQDMKVYLEKYLNNKDNSVFDSLVIVFFSLGDKYEPGNIYDKDGKEINKEEIFTMIKNSSAFKSKPKIVIISTYDFEEKTNQPDNKLNAVKSSVHFSKEKPNIDDLFVVSSRPKTEKGPLIIGNGMNGSYFIQALIHVFKKMAHEKSFMEMMEEVNTCLMNAMVPRQGKTAVADVMILEHSVQKSLFFFPGLLNVPAIMIEGWPLSENCSRTVKKSDIKKCTIELHKKICEREQVYHMTGSKKGKFLSVSNVQSTTTDEHTEAKTIDDSLIKKTEWENKCRCCFDYDKSCISQLFTHMKYESKAANNVRDISGQDVKVFLEKHLNNKENSVFDSLVIVFFSGGDKYEPGKIYDKGGNEIDKEEIFTMIKKSTAFKGKPKIVILRTYDIEEKTNPPDVLDALKSSVHFIKDKPNVDDLFVVSSQPKTEKGPWVVGDGIIGSYFIQALIHVFKNMAHEKSFMEMMEEVNTCIMNAMVPKQGKTSVAEVMILEHSVQKSLFFFPGLLDVPAVMMKVPGWPDLAAGGKFVKKTDIIPCAKDFLTTIQESKKIYSMTSVKKGKFFMISNAHCNCLVEENQTKEEKEKFELRYGECIRHTDFDKSNMSQLFKFMGYDTTGGMHIKKTKEEIKDFLKTELNEIDKDQSVQYDSLVILFLSGKFDCEPGKIYDCNGDLVSRKDILDIMKGSTHFKGKPKICIVQTYNFQEESKPYDATDSAAANDIIKGGDLNKDDIFMVSSYPRIEQGPWMIGDKLSGSYFIQALVHVFMKSACEKSFNDLLKEANSCLLQAVVPNKKDSTVEKTSVAQIVLLEHCEEKELFFFPGLTLKASDFTASMLGNLVSQPTD